MRDEVEAMMNDIKYKKIECRVGIARRENEIRRIGVIMTEGLG